MPGKLETSPSPSASSAESGSVVTYVDYQQPSVLYVDSISDANKLLKSCYSAISYVIERGFKFNFQTRLQILPGAGSGYTGACNCIEYDKQEIQFLRFYDFLRGECRLPKDLERQVISILTSSKSKAEQEAEIDGFDQEHHILSQKEQIQENRKKLAAALQLGDVAQFNNARKKQLHIGEFVSLEQTVQNMILDITSYKSDENPYINNAHRGQCTMS